MTNDGIRISSLEKGQVKIFRLIFLHSHNISSINERKSKSGANMISLTPPVTLIIKD